ncbi:MAG: hypothetical protein K8S55_01295 [Phycisphaerae bacterium]|nr:hypothetical protein [Phycisphaerae bacterium]
MTERKIKLVFSKADLLKRKSDDALVLMKSNLVDVETGQSLPCRNITLDMPMDKAAVATAEILISDIEMVD